MADYTTCAARHQCTDPQPYNVEQRLDRFQAFCNWKASDDRSHHPINCVSFEQATKYCAASLARLPTDVEWRWAASNGGQTKYPWGAATPDQTRVNGCGRECPPKVRALTENSELTAAYPGDDGFAGTAPVGSFPAGDSLLGIHDLAGNVAELTVAVAARESTGDLTAGGGCFSQQARLMSAAVQTRTAWSGATSSDLGFRCAATAGGGLGR